MKRRDDRMAIDASASCNKRRRKRLPRWADRLITVIVILVGAALMVWPWVFDRLEASGAFNQINAVSSTVEALPAEETEGIIK